MDTPTEPAIPPVPKPKGTWGMVLTATPIALTALATAFAGLSTSEMTQAMYHRSLAAQHQSRAGDQWAFFQAKRIRGNGLESSLEVVQALGHPDPFDASKVEAALSRLQAALPESKQKALADARNRLNTVGMSTKFDLPTIDFTPLPDPAVRQAYEGVIQAISRRAPETETTGLVAELRPETIDEAIRQAEDDADRFDKACEPVAEAIKQLKAVFKELGVVVQPLRGVSGPNGEVVSAFDQLDASFRAAVMDYDGRRYRQEAAFNRRAAEAYEVRVRRSGVESDRHRERSKRFFYSMLLAQVGVTVSSLALARAQRSLLWLLAAAAGVVAMIFTAYVYLSY
jgi:hypothetical protein